ncbi:MAG: hypothetical protein IPH35_20020 [Rhodoferax sp.]|nr:hypothetical protein [Rhodoferax sp.]
MADSTGVPGGVFPMFGGPNGAQRMDTVPVMDKHGIPVRADCGYHGVRRPCRTLFFRSGSGAKSV